MVDQEKFARSVFLHVLFWSAFFVFLLIAIPVTFMLTVANIRPEPIESTRAVVLSCTVKSNIEGVITLNDDCKITVIGEE